MRTCKVGSVSRTVWPRDAGVAAVQRHLPFDQPTPRGIKPGQSGEQLHADDTVKALYPNIPPMHLGFPRYLIQQFPFFIFLYFKLVSITCNQNPMCSN